jgi:hypothetical protein
MILAKEVSDTFEELYSVTLSSLSVLSSLQEENMIKTKNNKTKKFLINFLLIR